MRNYLVNHIFPTLTPALLEVAKLRPEDPVDFLVRFHLTILKEMSIFNSSKKQVVCVQLLN